MFRECGTAMICPKCSGNKGICACEPPDMRKNRTCHNCGKTYNCSGTNKCSGLKGDDCYCHRCFGMSADNSECFGGVLQPDDV
jgi:hypothetical protein